MQFIKTNWEIGADDLARRLMQELKDGKRVLWLVSGGSNVSISVYVMAHLLGYEEHLTIMLTDERYGPVGHADSNWQQLMQAGFDGGKATLLPTLSEKNASLDETAVHQEIQLKNAIAGAEVVFAQFGIGDDGHIAGILPDSLAVKDIPQMAVGYNTDKFDRVTMTFAAIEHVDVAYCFVYGSTKLLALQTLQNTDVTLSVQPSQILKRLPEVYVYNDQIGSKI